MAGSAFTFHEFFAGGGMAHAGLGTGWRCLFANDFDPVKAAAYADNWGAERLSRADVWTLTPADLPAGRADLAWASSPCQDFGLAGARAGLAGERSSALLGFWRLMEGLAREGRAPRTLVVENVSGLLSAPSAADFAALCGKLASAGYRFGALEIDAAAFTPQSRPRVFVVAAFNDNGLAGSGPGVFHTPAVQRAYQRLPKALQARWSWWRLPDPPLRNTRLADVLEPDAAWDDAASTQRLLSMMSDGNRAKLTAGGVGAAYRRVRREGGQRVQRTEARFDGLAGCLRTPAGGSSRQFVISADGPKSRLMTPREGARLMGLPDDYRLPAGSTAAWKVVGDGVAVPVVRWLAAHLLEPLAAAPELLAAE